MEIQKGNKLFSNPNITKFKAKSESLPEGANLTFDFNKSSVGVKRPDVSFDKEIINTENVSKKNEVDKQKVKHKRKEIEKRVVLLKTDLEYIKGYENIELEVEEKKRLIETFIFNKDKWLEDIDIINMRIGRNDDYKYIFWYDNTSQKEIFRNTIILVKELKDQVYKIHHLTSDSYVINYRLDLNWDSENCNVFISLNAYRFNKETKEIVNLELNNLPIPKQDNLLCITVEENSVDFSEEGLLAISDKYSFGTKAGNTGYVVDENVPEYEKVIILAKGRGYIANEKRLEMENKAGTVGIISFFAGKKIKVNGVEYKIVRDGEILCEVNEQ